MTLSLGILACAKTVDLLRLARSLGLDVNEHTERLRLIRVVAEAVAAAAMAGR